MAPKGTPESAVLAVRTSTDLAALGEFESILRDPANARVMEVEETPEEAHQSIINQILDAQTEDELEVAGNAEGWRELEGVPVQIQGFRWRASEYKEGPPVYCVVFGNRMDDGERVVLTTGSGAVMAQLCGLARLGRLPGAVRILEKSDKPTKGGFYPLKLVSTADEMEARREARKADVA